MLIDRTLQLGTILCLMLGTISTQTYDENEDALEETVDWMTYLQTGLHHGLDMTSNLSSSNESHLSSSQRKRASSSEEAFYTPYNQDPSCDKANGYGLAHVNQRPTVMAFPENPGMWVECENDNDCALMIPNATHISTENNKLLEPFWTFVQPTPIRSRFLFGRLPKVLHGGKQLTIDEDFGTCNPSMHVLPNSLRDAFPSGKWVSTLSGFHYKMWIVIHDQDFMPLATAGVEFLNADSSTMDGRFMMDARLLHNIGGEMLMSFSGYRLADTPHAEERDWFWYDTQLLAPLHLSAEITNTLDGSPEFKLKAYIDRYETRVISECPEKGLYADGPKKNFGFFWNAGDVYALDWIYPTQVGQIDTHKLNSSLASTDLFISELCFGLLPTPPKLDAIPWSGIQLGSCKGVADAELHNGPNPIWIEETREYLGIGHFPRSCSHYEASFVDNCKYAASYGHHYTHFFFTLSEHKPFPMMRIGDTEFCMSSGLFDPNDCDLIQFVSGLARDGDELVVGYGAMDFAAFVIKININDVLGSLVPANRSL